MVPPPGFEPGTCPNLEPLPRYKLGVLPLNYRGGIVKYNMTEQEFALSIKKRLDNLTQRYETKGEQLLYEQGILLGMLATLSYYDSKNFDLIVNRLNTLKQHE